MRIERLQSEFEIEVRIVQFPLHPDTPPGGMSLEDLFAGRGIDLEAAQQRMSRLMEAEGLPYGTRNRTYNSRLAQELAKWAETKPDGKRIHDALFRAYFVEGIDISRSEEVVAIAQSLGLPADEAREVLESRRFREDVDRDWARSAAMGVTGVPTFVAGGRGVVGAQPYPVLERLVIEAGAKRR